MAEPLDVALAVSVYELFAVVGLTIPAALDKTTWKLALAAIAEVIGIFTVRVPGVVVGDPRVAPLPLTVTVTELAEILAGIDVLSG